MTYFIENMVKEGEFITINNTYQYNTKNDLFHLGIETSLALAQKSDLFGFKINGDNKILYINVLEKLDKVLETVISQSKEPLSYENIEFLDLDLNTLLNVSQIEKLTQFIETNNFNVLIWSNVNIISEFFSEQLKKNKSLDKPLDTAIYLIKKISGMKTKVLSHYYNSMLEIEEFNKLSDLSTASITLSHENIITGYNLEFRSKYNSGKNYSLCNLKFDENKKLFLIKKMELYLSGVLFNENTWEDKNEFNPILY